MQYRTWIQKIATMMSVLIYVALFAVAAPKAYADTEIDISQISPSCGTSVQGGGAFANGYCQVINYAGSWVWRVGANDDIGPDNQAATAWSKYTITGLTPNTNYDFTIDYSYDYDLNPGFMHGGIHLGNGMDAYSFAGTQYNVRVPGSGTTTANAFVNNQTILRTYASDGSGNVIMHIQMAVDGNRPGSFPTNGELRIEGISYAIEPQADGAACTENGECTSGYCRDDYDGVGSFCADSATSCVYDSDSNGQAETFVASAGAQCVMDGHKTCTSGVWSSETQCVDASCSADGDNTYTALSDSTCSSGSCSAQTPTDCGVYSCVSGGASGDTCGTSCASDDDSFCRDDYFCYDGNDTCQSGNVGASCDDASDCNGALVCASNACAASSPPTVSAIHEYQDGLTPYIPTHIRYTMADPLSLDGFVDIEMHYQPNDCGTSAARFLTDTQAASHLTSALYTFTATTLNNIDTFSNVLSLSDDFYTCIRPRNSVGSVGDWVKLPFTVLPPTLTNPVPAHQQTDVATSSDISIDYEGGQMSLAESSTLTFKVSTTQSSCASLGTDVSTEAINGIGYDERGTITHSITGPLIASTTYYWCVTADDSHTVVESSVYEFTTSAPSPSISSPSPVGTTEASTAVTLSVVHNDTEGDPGTITFHIWDADPSGDCEAAANRTHTITSAIGAATDGGPAYTTDPTGLVAGTTYYWCARTNDGANDSAWSGVHSFDINTDPTLTNPSPSDTDVITDTTPTLSLDYDDADGHQADLVFKVYTSHPTDCTNSAAATQFGTDINVDDVNDNTQATTPSLATLTEGATYYWCATANDGFITVESSVYSFTVNSNPTLTVPNPTDAATANPLQLEITYTDPENTQGTVNFELHTDTGDCGSATSRIEQSTANSVDSGTNATHTVTGPLIDASATTYYWCVYATDADTGVVGWQEYSFTTPVPLSANGVACANDADCSSNNCRLAADNQSYCAQAGNICGQSGGDGYALDGADGAHNKICDAQDSWSCAAGYYDQGSDGDCEQTDPGYYSAAKDDTQSQCDAGYYGATGGHTASSCDGACTAGYYCSAGSTSATQNDCPENNYCEAASSTPVSCETVGAGYTSAQNSVQNTDCTAPATNITTLFSDAITAIGPSKPKVTTELDYVVDALGPGRTTPLDPTSDAPSTLSSTTTHLIQAAKFMRRDDSEELVTAIQSLISHPAIDALSPSSSGIVIMRAIGRYKSFLRTNGYI